MTIKTIDIRNYENTIKFIKDLNTSTIINQISTDSVKFIKEIEIVYEQTGNNVFHNFTPIGW